MPFYRAYVAFVACATLATPVVSWAASPQSYDALILGARNGDYPPALEMLKRQLLQTPIKRRALYDYIVISGWAGHDKQAIDAYENAGSPGNLPAPPLATLARSSRNARQWSKSLDSSGILEAPRVVQGGVGR